MRKARRTTVGVLRAFALAAAVTLAAGAGTVAGCAGGPGSGDGGGGPTKVVLYSTTSFQASGIYELLSKAFVAAHPEYELEPHFVGSGEALSAAKDGLADVVLAHDPAKEKEVVDAGGIATYEPVMENDFVIVGPKGDPAKVLGSSAARSMKAIAAWGAKLPKEGVGFVSRGQKSGTFTKELELWKAAGIEQPDPEKQRWYVAAGAGMGEVLQLAWQKKAYTLADRGTWLNQRKNLPGAEVLGERDVAYANPYHVLVVDAARFPKVKLNQEGAQAFADFLVSPEGQQLVGGYTIDGERLFKPTAVK